MKKSVLAILIFYRNCLSKLKLQCCRFYPSCSEYAIEAIEKYGILSGGWKSIKRVFRCNPFFSGGWDPVE